MIAYKHTCTISGKCYIGLSVKPIIERWLEHCSDANRHPRRKFFAAIKKYGRENWTHEILFESDDLDLTVNKEMEFIELYDSVNNVYNMSKDRFKTGIKHTPEAIENMREVQRAAHLRRKTEGRDGDAMLGKTHPNKGKTCANKGKKTGMTWEEIYGPEVAHARRSKIRGTQN